MTFFVRSEKDDNDRRRIGIYTTDCWEIKIADLVELGPQIAVRPYPHHILTVETNKLLQKILKWSEKFQVSEKIGKNFFETAWTKMPLDHSVAVKVDLG